MIESIDERQKGRREREKDKDLYLETEKVIKICP